MKYEIDIEIDQGDNVGELHCNIELELEIACFCEDIEVEDFTVNKVYVYDDSTGEEYALKTDIECSDFYKRYKHLIEEALDDDKALIDSIEDYLRDGQTERDIEAYEDSLENRYCAMAENIMFGGVDY